MKEKLINRALMIFVRLSFAAIPTMKVVFSKPFSGICLFAFLFLFAFSPAYMSQSPPSATIIKANGEQVVGTIKGVLVFRSQAESVRVDSRRAFTTTYLLIRGKDVTSVDGSVISFERQGALVTLLVATQLDAPLPDKAVFAEEVSGRFGLREPTSTGALGHMLNPHLPGMPSLGYIQAVHERGIKPEFWDAPQATRIQVIKRLYELRDSLLQEISIESIPKRGESITIAQRNLRLLGELRDGILRPRLEVVTTNDSAALADKQRGIVVQVSEILKER